MNKEWTKLSGKQSNCPRNGAKNHWKINAKLPHFIRDNENQRKNIKIKSIGVQWPGKQRIKIGITMGPRDRGMGLNQHWFKQSKKLTWKVNHGNSTQQLGDWISSSGSGSWHLALSSLFECQKSGLQNDIKYIWTESLTITRELVESPVSKHCYSFVRHCITLSRVLSEIGRMVDGNNLKCVLGRGG